MLENIRAADDLADGVLINNFLRSSSIGTWTATAGQQGSWWLVGGLSLYKEEAEAKAAKRVVRQN
ncbi:hypothetical protein HPP92_009813 [Vanilla planifolia]|uniref:Uncharacterized protein n=1 Tax=Vanilla planifolia TaxID=51239 RepID=A0A835R794_VANPL|nr:hypothetical protein HPP92_009813 [Vanilla planifolia]